MTNPIRVILGTSHEIQWEGGAPGAHLRVCIDGIRSTISRVVDTRHIALIAEEAPHDAGTVASKIAGQARIPYVQIDLRPHEWREAGIRGEMEARQGLNPQTYGAEECRFPHADDIRENFWLDRIKEAGAKPVLVVCGWAHVRALSKKIRELYGEDAQEMFSPERFGEWKIAEVFLDDTGNIRACGRPE